MTRLRYRDDQEVCAGDLLASVNGQADRVVVVVDKLEAVDGYDAASWAEHNPSGVLVESQNSNGVHLVFYPTINEDFKLSSRVQL